MAASGAEPQGEKRLKVGLVLGGGGAKGAAHVGALKVIEEVGIPIDYIAGTSIGSIVGGLYAMGYEPDRLDSLFRNQDWKKLFAGGVKNFLDSITEHRTFDQLQIPFRCVATDVKNEREEVFSDGYVGLAMRASMSIPGLFKAVRLDSMMLMDGGLINNLPVDVVRAMGADVVIAIDLQQNKHDNRTKSLKESIGLGGPLNWLVSRPDWAKYNENCKSCDVYVNPRLRGYGTTSFKPQDIADMLEIGREAVLLKREELLALKKRILEEKQ